MSASGTYAYIHCRPDGRPFYVGKGTGRRAYNFYDRRAHHRNVVKKCGGASSILVGILPCSTEGIAFDLERGLIACFRRMGVALVNLTDGGEGVSGRKESEATTAKRKLFRHSEESKRKMRKPKPAGFSEVMAAVAKGRGVSAAFRASAVPGMKGKTHSVETRAKMSAIAKLRGIPDAIRRAGTEVSRGKRWTHSTENRQKMSAIARALGNGTSAGNIARLQSHNAARRKPVVDVGTGEVHASAAELAALLGVTAAAVRSAIKRSGTVRGVKVAWGDNGYV